MRVLCEQWKLCTHILLMKNVKKEKDKPYLFGGPNRLMLKSIGLLLHPFYKNHSSSKFKA